MDAPLRSSGPVTGSPQGPGCARARRRGIALAAVGVLAAVAASWPALAATDAAAGVTTRPGRLSGGPPLAFPVKDFLIGEVALARFDAAHATPALLRAAAEVPQDRDLAMEALVAAVMADGAVGSGPDTSPQRVRTLAQGLAGQPLAALVLGNAAVRADDWAGARHAYASVNGGGFDGLRPLLVAAAEWGAGHPDAALSTLGASGRAGGRATAPGGIYALFGARIALASGRTAQAELLRNAGMSGLPTSNIVLVGLAADLAARRGEFAAARRMLHVMAFGRPGMALSEAGWADSLRGAAAPTASGMIAQVYAAAGFAVGAMMADTIEQQTTARGQGGGQDGAARDERLPPSALRDLSRIAQRDEIVRLRLALSIDPGLDAARIALAEVLADAGAGRGPEGETDAIAELAKVDPASPLAPAALWSEAGIEADLGRSDAARAIATRLAQRFPARPEPQQLFGDIAMQAKDFPAAVAAYRRAVDLQAELRRHPAASFGDTIDDNDAQGDWPLLMALGAAQEQAGDWPAAHAVLERALALAPDRPVLLNFLGYGDLEHEADDPHAVAAARLRLEKALSLAPEDPNIRDSLGFALLLQHDPQRALTLFEQAAEKMPEDPTINAHLGDAYMALGRRIEAVEQWEWALLCHPEPADAAVLRRKLAEAGAAAVAAPASAKAGP